MSDVPAHSPEELRREIEGQRERIAALERQVGRLSASLRAANLLAPLQAVPARVEPVLEPTAPVVIVPAPPPMPAPHPATVLRQMREAEPVLVESDFLSPAEAHAAPPAAPSAAPQLPMPAPMSATAPMQAPPRVHIAPPRPAPAKKSVGLEVALATKVLPIVGGVLLICGGVFLATVVGVLMPPGGRIALGYLFALGLAGISRFASRKSENVGHLVMSIALAFGYFVSFAAHFIPNTRCLPIIPSLTLMMGFAAVIVLLAERWKSEGTAMFAFALGILGALISARDAQGFAVVSLVVLSIGSGAMLIRNEWQRLTMLALVGTYLSYLALWLLNPPGDDAAAVRAHLVSLTLSHIVFTAAFWRWSRPWIAREMAIAEMAEHEAAPAVSIGLIPYSTGFAILNSLGFAGLSIFLLWRTQVYWLQGDKWLFALAALEAGRLAIPALRRGNLFGFHTLAGVSLATAGVMVAMGGTTESSILAAETLVLSIAASRAPMLRFLRPLSAIAGFLALFGIQYSCTTIGDYINSLAPAALILLSTLPWEAIWVRTVPKPTYGFLFHMERFSANSRALTAIIILFGVTVSSSAIVDKTVVFPLAAAILAALAIALRATNWTTAIACITGIGLGTFARDMGGAGLGLLAGWSAMMTLAFAEISRRTRSGIGVLVLGSSGIIVFLASLPLVERALVQFNPHAGAAATTVVAAIALAAWFATKLGPLPSIVPDMHADAEASSLPLVNTTRPFLNPWYFAGAAFLLHAFAFAALRDAETSLVSAGVLSAGLAVGWFVATSRKDRSVALEGILSAVLLALLGTAFAVSTRFGVSGAAATLAATMVVGAAAIARGSVISTRVALLALCCVPGLPLIADGVGNVVTKTDAIGGLAVCLACVALTRTFPAARRKLGLEDSEAFMSFFVSGWLVIAGSFGVMRLLTVEGLLPSMLATLSWAIYGAVLLTAGFVIPDKPMRLTSLAIFTAAVGRVLFVDLAGANPIVKVMSFMGVGLLLVLAGVAYGMMRNRTQEKVPDDAPIDQPLASEPVAEPEQPAAPES